MMQISNNLTLVFPADLFYLQSILGELANRGHRLRYPEKETAQSEDLLAGNSDRAEQGLEAIGDQPSSLH